MAMACRLMLLACLSFFAITSFVQLQPAHGSLSPVECDASGSSCTVVSAYREWPDRKPCRFKQVYYPATEEELVAAVAAAVKAKRKIRVVSKWAHSIPKLVCPGGEDGVLVSTRDYNRTVEVDAGAGTVTVDAGVIIKDLVEVLAAAGWALTHVPYWSGISVAGLLATGAHGSSLWGKGSATHEHVTRVRIVVPASAGEGYAQVRIYDSGTSPRELAAAKVSLGVLGAVSQVTLQVEPLFKRSLTLDAERDTDLESRLLAVAEEQEFGDVIWRPTQGVAIYRLDNRVPITTPGDGAFDFIQPSPVAPVLAARALEQGFEARRNALGRCELAAQILQTMVASGFGSANNRTGNVFEGYPVVGFAHHIQTSGACTSGPVDMARPAEPSNMVCPLMDLAKDKGSFVLDVAVSVRVSQIKAFIGDVRELLAKRPLGFCGLETSGVGFLMRFVKGGSSAYLGAEEDSVDIDFFPSRSDLPETPRMDQDVVQELEQILVGKYRGLPHWGKNRPVGFQGVPAKYGQRLKEFLAVKEELDPQGLFSNEWTDALLGVSGHVGEVKPFCALEGLCVCSEDVHCAPEAGYFCRPGLVYKDARVCRFEGRKTALLVADANDCLVSSQPTLSCSS